MVSFDLRLENSYWAKGFFNVTVDFERYVTTSDGPIDLYLGDASEPISGRVSRRANLNATPRIYGNKPLATFFQANHARGGHVQVEILSPSAIRVGGGAATHNAG